MRITTNLIAVPPDQTETTASVSGEVITVDGTAYDLSSVPEEGLAQPHGDHPFVGPITRTEGVIYVAVKWQYKTETSEADQPKSPPVFELTEGEVPDPVKRLPMEEVQ